MQTNSSQNEMDTVSEKLGKYLLMGWTMLGSSCVDHPTVPLMRERGGNKCICVLCDDKYYIEEGQHLLMYLEKTQDKGVSQNPEKKPEEKAENVEEKKACVANPEKKCCQSAEYITESDEDDGDEKELALLAAIESQREHQKGRGLKKESMEAIPLIKEENIKTPPKRTFSQSSVKKSKDIRISILESKIDDLIREIENADPSNAEQISVLSIAIKNLKDAISSL